MHSEDHLGSFLCPMFYWNFILLLAKPAHIFDKSQETERHLGTSNYENCTCQDFTVCIPVRRGNHIKDLVQRAPSHIIFRIIHTFDQQWPVMTSTIHYQSVLDILHVSMADHLTFLSAQLLIMFAQATKRHGFI